MTSIRDLATRLPADTDLRGLLGLTWHVTRPLDRAGITTTGDLTQRLDIDLLTLPGLGPRRLDALRTALQQAATR